MSPPLPAGCAAPRLRRTSEPLTCLRSCCSQHCKSRPSQGTQELRSGRRAKGRQTERRRPPPRADRKTYTSRRRGCRSCVSAHYIASSPRRSKAGHVSCGRSPRACSADKRNNVYFAVEVRSSLRLVLGPTAQRGYPAQNPTDRSHVATEHVLAAMEVIIATRAVGAHSHAQNVGEPFELKPVAVDDRQWLPSYGSEPLQIVGYVDFRRSPQRFSPHLYVLQAARAPGCHPSLPLAGSLAALAAL